jgi:hypothetical protein
MKKLYLILGCILLISNVTTAQYKINKKKYDYKTYNHQPGDPYNPAFAGFASFLVPGMGQMVSGEVVRGACFFGGCTGFFLLLVIGGGSAEGESGYGVILLGFTGMIAVDLISLVDAGRVAKVNNLVFRDKYKTSYKLQLSPYFGSFKTESIPAGLSLKVKF